MKTQHTPGPWNTGNDYTGDHYHHVIIIGKTGTSAVAYGPTANETKANAKLIAAAPELLEALHDAIEQLTVFSDDDVSNKEYIRQCIAHGRSVINKANGL